ncbi:hypothetical protein V6N13_139850 [Hibiscus sabdariffa]|uniref:NADH dehydrogenase [ubiquinone] 1 beta subcomplex subunit 8, mitochondrial n=2 Tax=Hibiscus sabdariffa TaxID=183260 RepID=A0ABR2QBV6_9ROSI
MAGKLSNVASRFMGGNGVVSRSVASSVRLRSGMGLPVGKHIVPDKPLPVNDELTWDNGTAFPEPCIDRIADTVGKYEALAWMCGGLSFFASLGVLAWWNDKASRIPFAPKVYPYDNLRVELGGEPKEIAVEGKAEVEEDMLKDDGEEEGFNRVEDIKDS